MLGLPIPAHQRVVSLVVLLLVLCHPGVAGDQVVHRFGVDAKLRREASLLRLVQNPALLLQHRGITKPGHLSMAVK